jgi:hypothetical protein
MQNLASQFMLEWYLEENFCTILTGCAEKIFRARDLRIANPDGIPATPRIDVLATVKGITTGKNTHSYIFPETRNVVYDAWQGELQTQINTNREISETHTPPQHYQVLGALRSVLYQPKQPGQPVDQLWPTWQPSFVRMIDIRELDSENSFDNEHTIDITTIRWSILFQINPEAWPNS